MAKTRCRTCDLYGEDPAPCHRCGHMPNREILPGCYGTIHETTDLSKCYCHVPQRKDVLVERLERLEGRVAQLEGAT